MNRRLLAGLLVLTGAQAQDGRVLRDVNPDDARLVGIIARGLLNTAGARGGLTPEVRELAGPAVAAYAREDWNRAWRLAARVNTLLTGGTLGEETELAASFDMQLDRRIVSGTAPLEARIAPLFVPEAPLQKSYRIRIEVRDEAGKVLEVVDQSIPEVAAHKHTLRTAKLPDGHYYADFSLAVADGATLTSARRDFFVRRGLDSRVAGLRARIEKQRSRETGAGPTAALEAADYRILLVERALREYAADAHKVAHPLAVKLRGPRFAEYTSDIFRLPEDVDFGESLVAELEQGKDPLAARSGDLRLAHRSGIDGTLQPFRVFVPPGFDRDKEYPLVVALHGASGDENTYMDRYRTPGGENLFQKLAAERGYILATPNARGPYGNYVGNAAKDVFEVIDRVQALYPIAEGQVFLTGHSMGGGGTWQLGLEHAARFRALAPVASGFGGQMPPQLPQLAAGAPEMPVLFCYGLEDNLATPAASRELIAVMSKHLKNLESKEYPDDHFSVGVTSLPAVFDFFDRHRPR